MRILIDFKCETCGNITEAYVDNTSMNIQCPCGEMADRMIGAPHIHLEGISGDFPSASDKWANQLQERAKIHAKQNS
jgi:hypothetical protein